MAGTDKGLLVAKRYLILGISLGSEGRQSSDSGRAQTLQIEALDSTLDMLGRNSKKALLFHLKESCAISLNPGNSFSLQQLEAALQQVLGASGASVILEHVILEMDRLSDKHIGDFTAAEQESSRTTFHQS